MIIPSDDSVAQWAAQLGIAADPFRDLRATIASVTEPIRAFQSIHEALARPFLERQAAFDALVGPSILSQGLADRWALASPSIGPLPSVGDAFASLASAITPDLPTLAGFAAALAYDPPPSIPISSYSVLPGPARPPEPPKPVKPAPPSGRGNDQALDRLRQDYRQLRRDHQELRAAHQELRAAHQELRQDHRELERRFTALERRLTRMLPPQWEREPDDDCHLN
jgi:hypothetical protein